MSTNDQLKTRRDLLDAGFYPQVLPRSGPDKQDVHVMVRPHREFPADAKYYIYRGEGRPTERDAYEQITFGDFSKLGSNAQSNSVKPVS